MAATRQHHDDGNINNALKRWLWRLKRRLQSSDHRAVAPETPEEPLELRSVSASRATLVSWLELDDNLRNEALEAEMAT